MTDRPVVIQKISWAELCPWTIIFRTLPIATSFTVLALALFAVAATPMGWMLSEVCLSEKAKSAKTEELRNNTSPYRGVFSDTPDGVEPLQMLGVRITGPREVFRQFVAPVKKLFDREIELGEFFYYLFGSLWTIAVWSFAGLGICRVCLLRLTRGEFAGLDDAFEFSVDNWSKACGAVLAPLAAVGVLCIPTGMLGLLMGLDVGVFLVGLLWFIVVGISIVMGILLLGLMFGWPLMIASVACESQNSFDSMTRSFAYVLQRPFHYVCYALIAVLFGGLAWLIVASVADGMVGLTYWSVSWGANLTSAEPVIANGERIPRIDQVVIGMPLDADGELTETYSMYAGRSMINFWNAVIKSLAAAFLYGLFWCLASAIYLLLRKDVDQTEMDEIFLIDEKRTYTLPPLRSDENGIPQIRRPEPDYYEGDDPQDPEPVSDVQD